MSAKKKCAIHAVLFENIERLKDIFVFLFGGSLELASIVLPPLAFLNLSRITLSWCTIIFLFAFGIASLIPLQFLLFAGSNDRNPDISKLLIKITKIKIISTILLFEFLLFSVKKIIFRSAEDDAAKSLVFCWIFIAGYILVAVLSIFMSNKMSKISRKTYMFKASKFVKFDTMLQIFAALILMYSITTESIYSGNKNWINIIQIIADIAKLYGLFSLQSFWLSSAYLICIKKIET